MKRKDLLLLTFLLTQTAPVWGMWNEDDAFGLGTPYGPCRLEPTGEVIRSPEGKYRIIVRRIQEFEVNIPNDRVTFQPHYSFIETDNDKLDPFKALPLSVGHATEKVAPPDYNGSHSDSFETDNTHLLYARWISREDWEHKRTIYTLRAGIMLNGQWITVDEEISKIINHPCSDMGKEEVLPGCYHYNGDKIFQKTRNQQKYYSKATEQHYRRVSTHLVKEIERHKGNTVIYVEPFSLGDNSKQSNESYKGDYDFERDLEQNEEGLPGVNAESLIFSDGTDIYFPQITQEIWQREKSQVGFFIASYNEKNKRQFNNPVWLDNGQNAESLNGKLEAGLYHRVSIVQEEDRCLECWKKLGEEFAEGKAIKIYDSTGTGSIPGMASFERIELQKVIQLTNQTTTDLSDKLDKHFAKYIKMELIKYCRHKINTYSKTLSKLRKEFTDFITTLKQLVQCTPEIILSALRETFSSGQYPVLDISKISNMIRNNSIIPNDRTWRTVFHNTITKIETLISDPQVDDFDEKTKVLTLKGMLIGSQDISNALRKKPQTMGINIYTSSTFFFDQDISFSAVSFKLLAPQIKTLVKKIPQKVNVVPKLKLKDLYIKGELEALPEMAVAGATFICYLNGNKPFIQSTNYSAPRGRGYDGYGGYHQHNNIQEIILAHPSFNPESILQEYKDYCSQKENRLSINPFVLCFTNYH